MALVVALVGVLLAGLVFWVIESLAAGVKALWSGASRPFTHFSVPCPVCGASNAFEKEEAARSVVAAAKAGAMEKLVQKARPCRQCRADLATTWRTHAKVQKLVLRVEAHHLTAGEMSALYGAAEEEPSALPEEQERPSTEAKARKRSARPKRGSWWG